MQRCGVEHEGKVCRLPSGRHAYHMSQDGQSWVNEIEASRPEARAQGRTLRDLASGATPARTARMDTSHLTTPTPGPQDFGGATYTATFDYARLNAQTRRVFDAMAPGAWMTLAEISAATGDPEASVSARLRDLRKEEFGALAVDRRRRGPATDGLWEYRLHAPALSS